MDNQSFIQSKSTLNQFFAKIYAFLALGIGLSALTTFVVVNFFTDFYVTLLYSNGLYWLFLIVEVAFAWYLGATRNNKSMVKSVVCFIIYSILNGITLSVILFMYTSANIINAFLSAAVTFAVMSVIGVYTKKDLSRIGHAGYSALIGIIISLLLNGLILHSRPVELFISLITVLVFSGITAYDNQQIKETYELAEGQVTTNIAIFFALQLYLDLINLFLAILDIFGSDD